MKRIRCIEITFPEEVEVSDDDEKKIVEAISAICDRYEEANPDRVMWPFGIGFKMLANPMMLSDDEPIPFDLQTFSIECSERENYDWPCAKCKYVLGDHKGYITEPPAGDCEYAPASKPAAGTS
jgi:hypothetical protein